MKRDSIRLLLADDDYDDCLFFEEALEELPLSVQLTTVNDGEQLMQHLEEESQKLPNILFLDLNMPRKNGMECLVEIKRDQKLKSLPVIIYSTSFDPETISLLYDHGAQHYIRKPSDFTQLKQVIFNALQLLAKPFTKQPDKEKFVLQP
jgi:CheY-like chemotaxis protein